MDALKVTCPYCRSERGERCTTWRPAYRRWAHRPPHKVRVRRAERLTARAAARVRAAKKKEEGK